MACAVGLDAEHLRTPALYTAVIWALDPDGNRICIIQLLIFSLGVKLITIRTFPVQESNDEIEKTVDVTCVVNPAQLADPPWLLLPVVVVVALALVVVEEGIVTDLVVREAGLAVVSRPDPDELVDVDVVVEDTTTPM